VAQTKIANQRGSVFTFAAEAFTADITTVATLAIASTERLLIKGWHLVVSANTVEVRVGIGDSSDVLYFPHVVGDIGSAGVGEPPTAIFDSIPGAMVLLPAGRELKILGGGTAAVLDGYVLYEVLTA